jgi:hypothetical protein
MKICSTNVNSNCPQEQSSIDAFFMEEANVMDENDTLLNATNYFNLDHEME